MRPSPLRRGLRMSALVAAALAVLALSAPPAGAQAEPGGLRVERTDVSSYPRVRLTVSAPREAVAAGAPSFVVTEDAEPRDVEIKALGADSLRVVLLVDTSGSMRGAAMEGARAAAQAFAARLPDDAALALVAFSTQAVVAAPFGVPRSGLVGAIDRLVASGETALYDAVGAALDTLGPPTPNDRRVVVLLSDGGDTTSAQTLDQVTARLAEAQTRLVAVELATSETQRAPLETLVNAAKGSLLSTPDPAALVALYDGIAADLVHSYELTYTSSSHGAASVVVALPGDPPLSADTRLLLPAAPPPPPPTPAPPPAASVLRPALLSQPWALYASGAALLVAFALLSLAVWRRPPRSVLPGRRNATAVAGFADWASRTAEHTLERHQWSGALNTRLEHAGIALRPGEFTVLTGCVALSAGAVGHLLVGPVVAAAATVMAILTCLAVVDVRVRRRQTKFADQLGDTLTLLAGSLRAGHSLLQAVDAVAREGDAPTSEEFRRLVVETRLGRPLPAALDALAQRTGSDDFAWVAQAIVIHRDVGGDLAQVLDRVAATIRERNQIRRQARALSAEGRLSAIVLVALPFFVAGFVAMTNPAYLATLTGHPVGLAMLGAGALLLVSGTLWLRKIVKVDF